MKIERTFTWTFGEPVPPIPAWLPWFGLFFLLVGLFFIWLGVFLFYQKDTGFEQMGVSASGTVIDLIRKRSIRTNSQGTDTIIYSPVVQFIDLHGKTQMLYSRSGSNPPVYRRGEIVTVLYDPDNPEFAVIDDWQSDISKIIPAVIGLIFSLIGLCTFLFAIYHRLKQAKENKVDSDASPPI